MKLLARYIVREVLSYTALVMAVLLILIGLYLFLTQTDELGQGRYGVFEALVVVVCRLPTQIFTLLPIGALMGALLALGNLARGSELVILRASGVSVFRLAGWVALAGTLLTVLTWGIGDYVAPAAERFADEYKRMAKNDQYAATGSENLWAKDGNVFVFVQKQQDQTALGGVYVLRFDDQRRLHSIGKADAASLDGSNQWRLKHYVETQFADDRVTVSAAEDSTLQTNLSGEFLGAATADAETLTGRALWRYIQYLDQNQLEDTEYRKAFWTRIARTCTLLVIVILAVPFSFGPMRSSGMGARMVIGILVGATFFLLAKLLSSGGVVYNLDPLIIAWGPTAVLLLATLVALARVR